MEDNTRARDKQTNRTYTTGTDKRTDTRGRGNNNPNLFKLKDLDDYKVASEDPDVRGWTVISGDNEKVGKVDELIVDTKRMKVRYLVVDAHDKIGYDDRNQRLLIPVGAARLHEKNNDVIVSALTMNNATHYPLYAHDDTITRDYEQSVRRFYESGGTVPSTSASENITEHETIRDAHTGKIYERQNDRTTSSKTETDSNSRNRVDVVTGESGDDRAYGKGQISDLPREDRVGDRNASSSNSIRGDRSAEDRRPDSNTTFGRMNTTSSTDVKDRIDTSGISSSRTSNLPNKELEQGPTGKTGAGSATGGTDVPEEGRVRIHDTDPNVESPKGSATGSGNADKEFHSTSDLNRSTSMGNDYKRGSNMGNLENRDENPGMNDRSRTSSPQSTDRTSTPGASRHPGKYEDNSRQPVSRRDIEHSSEELPDDRYDPDNDEFYTHDHFDEDKFYGNRRKRNK